MKLQISESVNANDWDANICSTGGTIFHSSIWANYTVAARPNAVPQFFTLISDNNKFLGSALGFQDYSQHKLIWRLTKRLWFDAMPVVQNNDEKTLIEFLRLLDNYARRYRYLELVIGSYASPDASIELERLGFNLTKRLEFQLLLEPTEEEIWIGLGNKRRSKIKKALKMGVIIHDLPVEKGILDLRRLQLESSERILKRGGPDLMPKLRHIENPIRVLLESDSGRIVGAKVDGELVSACLFTRFNNLVYFEQSGHTKKAFETQAPTLLLWECIKRYRYEGATKFNLGGCKASAFRKDSPEHGVYVYKKGLATECLQCATGNKVFYKTTHRIIGAVKSILRR